MNKIIKRVVSAVTAVAVALTAAVVFEVPKTWASANEHANHNGWTEFTASTGNISSSGSYYLNGDVELTNTITISGSDTVVNLCLNGQTVTNRGREVFELSGGATLNIYDCSGVGKIESRNLSARSAIEIGESCKLNLYSGIITTVANTRGFVIKNFGSLTISGGVISATDNVSSQPQAIIECDSNSSVTMTGGEISGDAGNGIQSQRDSNVTVNISGGTIACWYTCIDASMGDSVVTISGGTIKSTDTANSESPRWESIKNSGTMTITGGNFDSGRLRGFINGKTLKISGGTFKTSNSMLYTNKDNGELTISGGTFEKTGAGDCYFDFSSGTLNLQDAPKFNDAYIKLGSGKKITVTGELTYTTPCAVSATTVPGNFTSGWEDKMNGKDITSYFKSYKSNVNLTERDGEGYLHYYTVTFDANGGNCATSSSETQSNGKLASLPVPTKNNCDFGGWFTARTDGEQITTGTVFSGDTTVYAHWTNNCSHNYSDEWEYDGTNHWHECTECGDKKDTDTHSYEDWTLTSNPTLTATGTANRTCSICDYEQTESVPALTDTNVWTKDDTKHVDPTKNTTGTDVYHNDTYGDVTVEIPELSNTDVWGTPTHTEPTEDTPGKDVYTSEYGTVEVILEKTGDTSSDTSSGTSSDTSSGTSSDTSSGTSSDTSSGTSFDTSSEPTSSETSTPAPVISSEETLTIDEGSVSKKVEAVENVPKTELATPLKELVETILTPQERTEVKSGANIKIVLKIEDGEQLAPAEDKQAVVEEIKKLDGFEHGQYLDVSLLKIINESVNKITELDKPITVTFDVPDNLRGDRIFSVIRVHNGKTDVLNDIDDNPDTITIETDRFSTYALVYRDNAPAADGNNPSTGIAVSVIPITAALAAMVIAVDRRRK